MAITKYSADSAVKKIIQQNVLNLSEKKIIFPSRAQKNISPQEIMKIMSGPKKNTSVSAQSLEQKSVAAITASIDACKKTTERCTTILMTQSFQE
ncbi:MAG: hypothetical protein WCW77_01800 [Patescibacteria group bacterium]